MKPVVYKTTGVTLLFLNRSVKVIEIKIINRQLKLFVLKQPFISGLRINYGLFIHNQLLLLLRVRWPTITPKVTQLSALPYGKSDMYS